MSDDSILLTPDAALPTVPLAPAPWSLTGTGYILLMKLPPAVLDDPRHTPAALRGKRRGGLSMVMLVDYESSAVGPYRELLYIPGKFAFGDVALQSITRIYVSSMESVVNGRINWGIPKDQCDFDFQYGSDGQDRCEASLNGKPFAKFAFKAGGWKLPFSSVIVPNALLRLAQVHGGRQFVYVPSASGKIQFAKVTDWSFDAALFPDLAQGKVLACVKVPRFTMGFPVSAVTPV
ncbi:acetoacetate decarboxylase family protein [Nevskia sp.]|uniref:acetoacetate decarboxylase family protein n=1 Tax=Nevskia sp. TaxID=1929292 RepID=UPI0025FB1002|nr:acetoacetate decarboxylase family protein [Nevskia sp.]